MEELTRATKAFLEALKLPEGATDEFSFLSPREAESFRVSLYTIKKNLNNNTVLISIDGDKVSLSKKGAALTKRRILCDGTIIETKQENPLTEFDKRVEEIVQSSHLDPDWSQENKDLFTDQAIKQLYLEINKEKIARKAKVKERAQAKREGRR